MNKAMKSETGITLVESMIAVLILFVGLLSLSEVLAISVLASKTHGRDSGKTTVLARDKLDELTGLEMTDAQLTEGGSIAPAAPDGYVDYLDQDGNAVAPGSALYRRQWLVADEATGIFARKRIAVSVTSTKSFRYGTAPSTVLVTQMTRPKEVGE